MVGNRDAVDEPLSVDRSQQGQFDYLVHPPEKGDCDDEIEALGGKIFRIISLFVKPAATPFGLSCFFREHQGQYPIAYDYSGSCAAIYLSEAKRFGSVCIAHSHSQKDSLSPTELVFRMLSYPTRSVADYFMACSEQAAVDRYGRTVVLSDRFRVLNNGIDITRFACAAADHSAAKRVASYDGIIIIGHVGRLVEVNNHRFVIDSFYEFKAMYPDALLFLVGHSPLEKYATECGAFDSEIFFGVSPSTEDYLKLFGVFIFPSVREGLGMLAVETRATGLP